MKKLLIISAFGDQAMENNSRLSNISNYADAEKIIVTTDFDHIRKEYKTKELNQNIHYLHVPAYKKNLSLKRIYSHIRFSVRLKRFLKEMEFKPDVIYCVMPTSTSALVCGKYCRKKKIKFVIDVLDLWPNSLIPVQRVFSIFRFILLPWQYITHKAYRLADIILGESDAYVAVARKYNPLVPAHTIYLGVDPLQIEELKNASNISLTKESDEVWICYAGTLGNSYDFDTLLTAVRELNNLCKYKLLFVGGGDKHDYLLQKIEEYELNGIVTGKVSYSDYLKYLSYCDIGVNNFKSSTLVVHSYKFNDYVASNLFVLNNLKGETAELIDKYKVGLNFDYSQKLLKDLLKEVVVNWEEYKKYKDNNKKVINEVLDKSIIYPRVLSNILEY